MTTLLRASDSAGFLRIVPALAGFTPRQSIVLLPFRGSRAYGAMRLDLPADDVSLEQYADAAVGLALRVEGTDAVAVVVYTDAEAHPTPDGLVLPWAVEVDELLGCADDAGLRVVDALCVTPGGWSSYLVDEPSVGALAEIGVAPAPRGGDHDVSGSDSSVDDVSGDQLAGSDLPAADPAEKERVEQALLELSGIMRRDGCGTLTGRENPLTIAALVMVEDVPVFFESVLKTPDDLPPFATAALLWCLDRPLFRDVALAQWATDLAGGMRTLDAQLAFADSGISVPDELGQVFLGRGTVPDVSRLRVALSVVRHAAAHAPRASRSAPLTVAAWLSWALGRSSHAGRYLEQVREIDPQYGLAALLETMIGGALLPEWAFRRGPAT